MNNSRIKTNKIRAILFDIDGTLSDSDDQMAHKFEKILRPFIWRQSRRIIAARWLVFAIESPGNFLYNLADRFDLDSIFIRLISILTQTKKYKKKEFWIIPGVEDLINTLNKKYPLGIVSARDKETTMAFLEQYDLLKYFSVIVSSQTCRYTKPFPDPMLYAAEKLGVAPQTCLMIGDTTVDIKAAKLAGMQTVGVLCGFGRKSELERAGADLILQSTSDLINVFQSVDNEFSRQE